MLDTSQWSGGLRHPSGPCMAAELEAAELDDEEGASEAHISDDEDEEGPVPQEAQNKV